MAESKAHMDFVRRIVAYSTENIPMCDKAMILTDLPESIEKTPRVIGGYHPDMYHKNCHCIIIGEAKTDNDIENQHTYSQLDSYIEEVRCYNIPRHIVMCCSMISFARMKNMILRKKINEKLDDITFHIIDVYSKIAVL